MKKPIHTIASVTLASCILFAPISYAGGWGHSHSSESKVARLASKLELDDTQRALLTSLMQEMETQSENMRDARRDLRESHRDQTEAFWTAERLTAQDIQDFQRGQREAMLQAMQATAVPETMAEHLATLYNSLNPDQRETFAEMMARRKGFSSIFGHHSKGHRGKDRDYR